MESPNRSHIKKALAICPPAIGDYLMCSPALALLSETCGANQTDALVTKSVIRSLAEASGLFRNVHFFDFDEKAQGVNLRKLIVLHSEKYDASISFFPTGNWRNLFLNRLIGAPVRGGFHYPRAPLSRLLQTSSFALDTGAHEAVLNFRLVEELLGLEESRPPSIVYPFSPENDGREGRYYVCHPGSSVGARMLYKRLPVAEYAHLADLLFHEYGLRGVLIGGLEEQELHEELQSLAPDSLSIAPVGDFQRLADMIGLALFYIGGDSGLMHTSAALGKRCIAFFGPSDESRTGPFFAGYPPDRHLILRRDDLACAPCFKIDLAGKYPECVHGDARCLTKFPMESVWNRISGFVSEILKTEEVRGEVAQRYL